MPLMGDLPKSRIDVSTKTFQDVGIDFGGPFVCKGTHTKSIKAYFAPFVCFASRAKHLEAVSDLTTQACIAALRRFTARPGCPAMIYTDIGSNFAGTKSEIESLKNILKNEHTDSFQAEVESDTATCSSFRRALGGLNKRCQKPFEESYGEQSADFW